MSLHETSSTTDPTREQHVLVIGAGPGIGAGIARRFGREGFTVTLLARQKVALDALAQEIRAGGATVHTVQADVSDLASYRSALAGIFDQPAAPGVIVYNVVHGATDGLLTSDAEYLARAYTVDLLGAVVAAQVAVPHLKATGGGTLLFTGGGLADTPYAGYASSSLGKAALRSAATMLGDELRSDRIHVASVTINGTVEYGTPFSPDLIAERYWQIHTSPIEEWKTQYPFDGLDG